MDRRRSGCGRAFRGKLAQMKIELSDLFVESHKLEKEIKKRLG
jgi:hypothetical protein